MDKRLVFQKDEYAECSIVLLIGIKSFQQDKSIKYYYSLSVYNNKMIGLGSSLALTNRTTTHIK